MRQITMVSRIAQRQPAAKTRPSNAASGTGRGSSIARTSTTTSRLPTCAEACPQMRTKEKANTPRQASGIVTIRLVPRRMPKPAVTAAPMSMKASRAGSRRRTGPPESPRQTSRAARAASSRGGQCSHWSAATMKAMDNPARTPSARLIARRSMAMGNRARFASGVVARRRIRQPPRPGLARYGKTEAGAARAGPGR